MKKITSLLLMVFIAVSGIRAYDFKAGDLCYNITNSATNTVEVARDNSYYNLETIIIPATVINDGTSYSVTGIGDEAFYGCQSLTSIDIPNSVTNIGNNAFSNCNTLTTIDIPSGVTEIGNNTFTNCLALVSVTIPEGVTSIGYNAFGECYELVSVNIPNSVTNIGSDAFAGCTSLTSINLPNGITKIEASTFSRCSSLTSVTIPNSVSSIDGRAFNGCSSLTSIIIPDNVTSIEDYVFEGCSNLASINIPNGVTSIKNGAFSGCSNLASLKIPNSVTSIGQYAFSNCKALTAINIPSSVTSIEFSTFSGCSSLASVDIPSSVTSISNEAFFGCSSLKTANIPSVTHINISAFNGCSSLTSVIFSDELTYIGASAFNGCSSLTYVKIPNAVTNIGDYTFNGCSQLNSLVIGNSVNNIEYSAFAGCDNLAFIYCYPQTPPSANNTNFGNVYSKATLYVSPESMEAYQASEPWNNFKNIAKLPPYTVKATANDETYGTAVVSLPLVKEIETEVTVTAKPIEGYKFVNWTVGEEVVSENTTYSFVCRKDYDFVANFIPMKYPVTFDVDGEKQTEELDYKSEITAPKDPVKTGYTFTGWSPAFEKGALVPLNGITYTAQWKINQYTITFDTDGGSEIAPITQDYATEVTAPADPTKIGHTFIGWDKEMPKTVPAESITLKAQWKINQYTITFDTDGGSEIEPITQDYATKVTAPADPTKTGYTFKGWDKEIPETIPAEDVTVKALWQINQYTITFDTDGGSEIAPITQDYATEVTAPADPTKIGHTFMGWDKEMPKTVPAESITLKAQWKINQYTITFDTDGGSEIKPIKQDYATKVTAPAAPTKAGYTFKGWDKEIPETIPAEDVTVKALWQINQYTITFDTDGGSEIAPITQDYATEVTAPADPTKIGHTFMGWDKEMPKTVPAESITLKAQWKINQYTITFDTDGGSEIKPIKQDYATKVTAPAAPTKTGYTFKGWDKEIPETIPAEDVAVKALWQINQYNVTFKIGDEVTTKSLDYGSEITAPEVPEKEGHTFTGWSPELDETVPAKDVTYTAVYEVNTYKLTYILDGVEVNSIEVKYGEKIEDYIPEVAEGRAFEGWNDNIPETMPAHDVTIHGNTVTSIFGVTIDANETVPVYSLAGTLVMKLDANNTIDRLPSGVYIIKGKKVVIKRK